MKIFISRLIAALCLAISFAHAPAIAEGNGWRVTQLEGVVRVSQPGSPARDARHGQDLSIGTVITTGRDSSATIDNGLQTITIFASSRTTLAPESRPGRTSIFQGVGTALFKVDRRRDQHFEVNTPLLAAVVKGTTFTVTAGPQDDVVHVSSGLVEVRPLAGAERADVAPGQTVRVNRMAPEQMTLATPSSDAALPAGVVVPSVDYAGVSNNLFVPPAALAGNVQLASNSNAGGVGANLSDANPQNPTAQAATSAILVSAVSGVNGNGAPGGLALAVGLGNGGGNGNANGGGVGLGLGLGNGGGNGNANGGGVGLGLGVGNGGGNGNANGGGVGLDLGVGNGDGNGNGGGVGVGVGVGVGSGAGNGNGGGGGIDVGLDVGGGAGNGNGGGLGVDVGVGVGGSEGNGNGGGTGVDVGVGIGGDNGNGNDGGLNLNVGVGVGGDGNGDGGGLGLNVGVGIGGGEGEGGGGGLGLGLGGGGGGRLL